MGNSLGANDDDVSRVGGAMYLCAAACLDGGAVAEPHVGAGRTHALRLTERVGAGCAPARARVLSPEPLTLLREIQTTIAEKMPCFGKVGGESGAALLTKYTILNSCTGPIDAATHEVSQIYHVTTHDFT